ncbi:hypothetical protein RPHASCH2410_PD04180 (plasmid) [Rhizobium phaseoli Ch24-10]|nr:hypothetical protein RPHASCH2410_PD04180 [Rhizobium phaseoli Ch24-10]
MDFGSDAKHLLPRRGSLRLFADFPAGLEVVIDCLMEGFLEFSDTVTVKADYIGDTCNPAEKHIVLSLEFDASVRPVWVMVFMALFESATREHRAPDNALLPCPDEVDASSQWSRLFQT